MRMHAMLMFVVLSSPALGQDDAAPAPPKVPRAPTPSPPGDPPKASAQNPNPPAESPRPPQPQTVTLQVPPQATPQPPQTVTLQIAPAAPPPPQTVTLNLQPAAPPPQTVTLQIVPAPAPAAVVAAAPVAVPVAAAPAVTTTAARLWYPGPLRQAIGAFGEHLALQRMARVYVPVPATADVAVQPALVRTVQVAAPQPVTYLQQADLPPLPQPVYASPQLVPVAAKRHHFRGLFAR